MQRYGRQVQREQCHVLHNESVDTRTVERPDEAFGLGQFVVVENGVERDVDASAVDVGKLAEAGDVVDAVARRGTCAEVGPANVDGVGTVQNGLAAAHHVAGRGKQFDGLGNLGHVGEAIIIYNKVGGPCICFGQMGKRPRRTPSVSSLLRAAIYYMEGSIKNLRPFIRQAAVPRWPCGVPRRGRVCLWP